MTATTPPLRTAWNTLPDPPRVSVVMTGFKGGRFMEEAIHSVAPETRLRDELLIVDDGATDDSAGCIERHLPALPFSTCFEATPDCGQAAAIHLARSRATGDVATDLDSDDLQAPAKLERAPGPVAHRPGVAVHQHNFADVRDGLERPVVIAGNPQLHGEAVS